MPEVQVGDEYRNANTLAHAVNNAVGERYSPRPYNRFSPDDTVWWLVPSTDWPAFRYAKLFFDSRPEDVPGGAKGIYCGVNVEKGLSLKVKDFYPNELIQSFQWAWERFTTRIAEEFPVLPPPQFVWIGVSYIPPEKNVASIESFLAQKESFKASQAVFTIDAQQQLALVNEPYVNEKCIEIAEHLQGLPPFSGSSCPGSSLPGSPLPASSPWSSLPCTLFSRAAWSH
jgi:hypothetical protein